MWDIHDPNKSVQFTASRVSIDIIVRSGEGGHKKTLLIVISVTILSDFINEFLKIFRLYHRVLNSLSQRPMPLTIMYITNVSLTSLFNAIVSRRNDVNILYTFLLLSLYHSAYP